MNKLAVAVTASVFALMGHAFAWTGFDSACQNDRSFISLIEMTETNPPPTKEHSCYLFSSFRDNGQDGLHLAWSMDGLKWTALKDDKSFLVPQVGREKIMRDPCLIQGPDGVFQLIWTDSWKSQTIGHASSRDLVNWSEQQTIPVMEKEPAARNCWAPEIIYDEKRHEFLIFWSTTIPGRFPETDASDPDGNNHRIYATTTRDFKTFTPTRLFFDPGFNVIDATILKMDGKFHLFFKDETGKPVPHKNLRLAVADDVEGPYVVVPEPLDPPGSWTEGPAAIQIGKDVIVYFDCYTRGHYGALRSSDFRKWEDVTNQLSFPADTRHGTVLKVSEELVAKLKSSGR